jgi:hypothetical protein
MSDMGHEIRSVLGALAICAASGTASADPVTLAVEFKLTDLDDRPLPGAPVRLVLGSTPGWQSAGAGLRFETDASGAYRWAGPVALDKQWRKLPTNFLSSLVSRPQQTDHLRMAAELEYMTFPWLYVVDVYRLPGGGEVLLEGFSVYTRDARGEFTNKAKRDAGGWIMADLGGLALTQPGYEPSNVMLEPDPADPSRQRWTLRITFKKSPAPVRR